VLPGRHKVDVSDYWEAVTPCEQIRGRERKVSSNLTADGYVRIRGIQACKIRADVMSWILGMKPCGTPEKTLGNAGANGNCGIALIAKKEGVPLLRRARR